jgi:hypothetical protein
MKKWMAQWCHAFLITLPIHRAWAQSPDSAVTLVGNRLSYTIDSEGNRVPDFSYVGYDYGNSDPPVLPVQIELTPSSNDLKVCVIKKRCCEQKSVVNNMLYDIRPCRTR